MEANTPETRYAELPDNYIPPVNADGELLREYMERPDTFPIAA